MAQSLTLTRASKQLGLAQPSLSQQLSRLEAIVGTRLFDRTNNQMILTDAGQFLLRHALLVLNAVDEAEVGLREFSSGARGVIRVAGLNSILRVLMPATVSKMRDTLPGMEVDLHEVAPAEALELLYARRVAIGLIASNSVSQSSTSFLQIPIMRDPYVLAVPSGLDISRIENPESDLSADERDVLNNCIEFNFGTQHALRVERWYQRILPQHQVIARCRNYEVALGMVQAGLGVCMAPALTAHSGTGPMAGVDLYRTDQPDREIVAMAPAQYTRLEPFRSFILALQDVARTVEFPPMYATPPFIKCAAQS
ncbi:LysR family transcriptional regulator [Microvirga sp. M2]|uniref:LysR family transcriptional regulator n=1 Tax=Microvirga sp. M2 TaxID=3073270 RepID=UPI0039C27E33